MNAKEAIAVTKTFEKVDFFMIGNPPFHQLEPGGRGSARVPFSIINLIWD